MKLATKLLCGAATVIAAGMYAGLSPFGSEAPARWQASGAAAETIRAISAMAKAQSSDQHGSPASACSSHCDMGALLAGGLQ